MDNGELLPHLFRTEYRKIVAVLCRRFGFDQVEIAEDIASDTFLTAANTWGVEGSPPNPTAWLYNVAKNKAKNYLLRQQTFTAKVSRDLQRSHLGGCEEEVDLSPQNIEDSQLQMMFAICHPSISSEAQIGLSLRILCGFGIEEIAAAFLTNKETINKRLYRAKDKLREEKIKIELPGEIEIDKRLAPVLTTIYLLFNEGYYSISQHKTIRKELCLEAMRLCTMLVENEATNKPQVNALLSLMCFHASRFEARLDTSGDLILYEDQDSNLWNEDLVSKGGYFLQCSAGGDKISKYHLEAGIAYWNTKKHNSGEKWENIVQLYDQLLQLEYSPIAALNRAYAYSKLHLALMNAGGHSRQAVITQTENLNLANNQFYFILLGELYSGVDNAKAKYNFHKALSLTKTPAGKAAVQKKLDKL